MTIILPVLEPLTSATPLPSSSSSELLPPDAPGVCAGAGAAVIAAAAAASSALAGRRRRYHAWIQFPQLRVSRTLVWSNIRLAPSPRRGSARGRALRRFAHPSRLPQSDLPSNRRKPGTRRRAPRMPAPRRIQFHGNRVQMAARSSRRRRVRCAGWAHLAGAVLGFPGGMVSSGGPLACLVWLDWF